MIAGSWVTSLLAGVGVVPQTAKRGKMSNKFTGLALVLQPQSIVVPGTVDSTGVDTKVCNNRGIVLLLLSWHLRVFFLEVPPPLSTSLLARLHHGSIIWMSGRIAQGNGVNVLNDPRLSALPSQQNLSFSSPCVRIFGAHGVELHFPTPLQSGDVCPSLVCLDSTSVRLLASQGSLSNAYRGFLCEQLFTSFGKNTALAAASITTARVMHPPIQPAPSHQGHFLSGLRPLRIRQSKKRRTYHNLQPQPIAPMPIPSAPLPEIVNPGVLIDTPSFCLSAQTFREEEGSSEEDVSDQVYARRHRPMEREEKQTRLQERQPVQWAVCDEVSCRKWRVIEEISPEMEFYCGNSSVREPAECAKLDDWIVRCVGLDDSKLLDDNDIGTVEVLVNNIPLMDKLHTLGFYYHLETQAINSYSGG